LKSTVAAIRNGVVNSEVILDLPGEKTVTSICKTLLQEKGSDDENKRQCISGYHAAFHSKLFCP
jgi:hypothetical protein